MHDYPHLTLFNARTRQAVTRAADHAGRAMGRRAIGGRRRAASQRTGAVDRGPTPAPSRA